MKPDEKEKLRFDIPWHVEFWAFTLILTFSLDGRRNCCIESFVILSGVFPREDLIL
jgi:hypothetical protein